MYLRRTPNRSRVHTPHVYRNPCTGRWICDFEGSRVNPGPDRSRTVCRTHQDAVRVAVSVGSGPRLPLGA